MKELRIECTWRTTHTVEVPDDYEPTGGLDDEWADQVNSGPAELIDWEIL